MTFPVVIVHWGDAFIETDDFDMDEAVKTEPVYRSTVGFLLCVNKHGYVLATDEYEKEGEGFASRMFIPRGMVHKVTQMEKKVG